jgi:3' terminal RNA ribose 2'-O-methyltransferase Hen1
MLLTLTTTHPPATDLGYLLHKNPARAQSFDLSSGRAHVFYPEATAERCTAALLLELDPVGLVRGRQGPAGNHFSLEQYVNDRPYVSSSFLSVAIAQVFGSALNGKSKDRPELTALALPLTARLAVVPCHSGEGFLRRLFEPLGYQVRVTPSQLDSTFPDWGVSPYFLVELTATCRLADLLSHLYVLLPVLDNDKHYWVGSDEVEKLLKHGENWLATHPLRDVIARRYLKHQRSLTTAALARLAVEDADEPEVAPEREEPVERVSLHEQRLETVLDVLRECGATRVLDLGCGSGKLLRLLLAEKQFTEIVGVEVSYRALEIAAERLHLDRLPERQRQRIQLLHGSLLYRDRRLEGFDAAAVVEVIEHLDKPRLAAFERVLFEFARPRVVALTTPNVEYNVRLDGLPAGALRHADHRFEWSRGEFATWANGVAERFGYGVRLLPVGPEDAAVGAPSQMGVFERRAE